MNDWKLLFGLPLNQWLGERWNSGKRLKQRLFACFWAVRKRVKRAVLCTKQLPVSYKINENAPSLHIRDGASAMPDDDAAVLDCIRVTAILN
jgi:hypothetical protein